MGKHTPASEQRRLVALWHATDSSMASFARAHGVRPSTFATWVGRHREAPVPRAFLELAVSPAGPDLADDTPGPLAVRVGEHALRFELPPPPAWFAAVLRELSSC